MASRSRFWVGVLVPGVCVTLVVPGSLVFHARAAENSPIAMHPKAVTLELVCRDGAESGKFHPSHARVLSADTWAAAFRSVADVNGYAAVPRGGNRPRQQAAAQAAGQAVTVMATVVPEDEAATLQIETEAGTAEIRLCDVGFQPPRKYLNGLITAAKLYAATRVVESPTENDYPSAVRAPDGTIWAAYVAYKRGGEPDMAAAARHEFGTFIPKGNGDQVFLVHFDGKAWSEPMSVTDPLLDLWKPTVTVDGKGRVYVAWSQQVDHNWDVYRRCFDPAAGQWADIERMTTDSGSDINVVSTTDSAGNVWWAWQGRRGKHFQILLTGGGISTGSPIAVTDQPADHWDPAIAADHEGNVYVAWDSYENGNFDVFMRRYHNGTAEPVIPVATFPAFEARPSLAIDKQNRVWIAYEMSGPNWGKDFGRMAPKSASRDTDPNGRNLGQARPGNGVGIPLYQSRHVVVKCYADGRLQQPAVNVNAIEQPMPRPKSLGRIAVADDGRVWLFFRHHPLPGGTRETWAEYATSYDGKAWSKPVMLSDSDGIMDNRPAVVPFGPGGALAVYSSDWRLRGANNVDGAGRLPLKTDLYAALLQSPGRASAPELAAAEPGSRHVEPVHPREGEDKQKLRELRVEVGGKTYQLARGEFHRHTEYTAHRDGDSLLEDMWRYAQDAADMDWLGNGDHDNGWGHQYPWWITQKTMDIFYNPPYFITPYTYERSVVWPNGHRNVIFTQRGIRTLPRGKLPGDPKTGSPDTKMLYAYLHEFHGICASHTSATNMGTDWRDNDPEVEPVVEIYQGDRNNYECESAPRGLTPSEVAGAKKLPEVIHSQGFVWNALAKGYRLGFESSSDHVSTHCSYAILLVQEPGRQSIVEAFKARRCYAATDNIGLVVKCGDHLMGEEFTLAGKPTLEIKVVGSAPVSQLDIVRNNRFVYSTKPNRENVEMQWTDADPSADPVSYYYVRVQQADGNLAWCSPMWIHPK